MKPSQNDLKSKGLIWPRLIQGALIKQYKRFLADVRLKTGEVVTAHCPNSGSMKACSEPGRTVYLSNENNPGRKLRYTWQIIHMPTSLVGVNTRVPNRLVEKSIAGGLVAELAGYSRIFREIDVGRHSRLDLLLESKTGDRCFVEVKNCTRGLFRMLHPVAARYRF